MPRFVVTDKDFGKEIKKAKEIQVKPSMTKKGPRKGYERFDPREKHEKPKEEKHPTISPFGLYEADPVEFVNVRNQVPKVLQDYFTPYTPDEIRNGNIKVFLSDGKKAGVAVKSDGDIVNLFSLEKGAGKNALLHAIMNGGRKLDCFDKKAEQEKGLPDYYKTFGFVEVHREKNWTEGGPDVVYMELLPRREGGETVSKSVAIRKAEQMMEEKEKGKPKTKEKDKAKLQWRQDLMKRFKEEDYAKMDSALLEMMGEEATDADRAFVQKMLKNKK